MSAHLARVAFWTLLRDLCGRAASHQASALLQLRQEQQEDLGAGVGPAFCLLLSPKPELARHVDLSGLWGSWSKAVALPSRTAFFLASAPGRRHESTEAPH